jgi:hypothetical protein
MAEEQAVELYVVSAASFESGPVAPGQLVRLYGHGLTRFARVSVNGAGLNVTDAGENWVEVVAPEWLWAGEAANLQVEDFSVRANVSTRVVGARPGIFTTGTFGRGEAASVEAGTIVVTGVGPDVRVSVGERPVEVIDVRPLGGGRTAIRFQAPEDAAGRAVMVWSGETASQPGVVLP